jgi:hypothetical protein
MKFFAIRPDLDPQIDLIIQRIQLRKNGETVDLHKKRGIIYGKTFGVSLHHLKEIAASQTPSFELADRLWHRQIRETMILATMLCPPAEISIDNCFEWAILISTSELVEQLSLNLLAQTPFLSQLAIQLKNSNNNLQYATALFAAGWALRAGNAHFDGIEIFEALIPSHDQLFIPEIRRGMAHYMKQLVRHSPQGMSVAQTWINANKTSTSREVQMIIAETDAEINWQKEKK